MVKEYGTETLELMQTLLELQKDSAPIEMSIGYCRGNIVQQGILLKKAPPLVLTVLSRKGYVLDLIGSGILVYK